MSGSLVPPNSSAARRTTSSCGTSSRSWARLHFEHFIRGRRSEHQVASDGTVSLLSNTISLGEGEITGFGRTCSVVDGQGGTSTFCFAVSVIDT